jgi:hypothetical protein
MLVHKLFGTHLFGSLMPNVYSVMDIDAQSMTAIFAHCLGSTDQAYKTSHVKTWEQNFIVLC